MKIYKGFLTMTVFCLLTGWYGCYAQDIHFTLVAPPKDAPWSQVVGMSQGHEGFLWIATQAGLYKYDGHRYTSYLHDPTNSNSIGDNRLYGVLADKNGIIWIGTYLKGLDRLDPATGIITHFQHLANNSNTISNDTVTSIMQDKQGMLWIGTFNGLNRYNPQTKTFTRYYHIAGDSASLSNNLVNVVYEDHEGAIWIGTGTPFFGNRYKGGGLNRFNPNTGNFKRYLHDPDNPQSIADNRVMSIFEDSHSNLWVGTAGDGLQILHRSTGVFTHYNYNSLHPETLSRPPLKRYFDYAADFISFITEDVSGRIWIGTLQGGINVYDPSTQKVTYYGSDKNSKEKLPTNLFYCAYRTKDGTLWIGNWYSNPFAINNLYKINPYQTNLPFHSMQEGVFNFTEDSNHTLWMATSNGLIHKDNAGKTQRFLLDKDTSSYKNVIFSIAKDKQNKLWAGTLHGLYLFDPLTHKFTGYHHQSGDANSLCNDTVFAVSSELSGRLWVGTLRGLDLMNTETGKIIRHFKNNPEDPESISENYILSILVDTGAVWIGTYDNGGINRFNRKSGHFKRYLPGMVISCISRDNEGTLWVGTNLGLFKYNKQQDKFSNFALLSSKISSTSFIHGIVEDKEQNLWLQADSSITKLNLQNNAIIVYGISSGVKNLLTSAYARQNGEILFGARSGYYGFDPEKIIHNIPPSEVIVTGFLLNSKPVVTATGGILPQPLSTIKSIHLKHNQNTFSFEFASIDFASSQENHLQYQLENYGERWQMAGDNSVAYYFNVPPGHYIFRVKAENDNGVWSERDIEVTVSPPWWTSWWAIAIFILLSVVIVWAIVYFRSRELKRKNRLLDEKVNHRTEQLRKSLEELKSTQSQLIQSEKMASLGELTAGIAHEIQNPLNFVNNFSDVNKEMLEELKAERLKLNADRDDNLQNNLIDDVIANEEKINHHGKRADAIVKGMLQHSRKSSGQKELTDINALADEYLRLSYHGLRAKDKNFNATIETDFDRSIGKINIIPQDIGRVLLNLYNNAFYAVNEQKNKNLSLPEEVTPFGKVSPLYEPTVSVTTKKSENRVCITVRDNGNGIPQKIIDKIFQPFFTTKPTGQGTGLGLSLSYDIIKAHGGEIKVESKEGEGTKFIIFLPES